MKIALENIKVDCCRNCPFYDKNTISWKGTGWCLKIDGNVHLDKIHKDCPLEDLEENE